MTKRYTRKTFPAWTPPLFGWQYRWKIKAYQGGVSHATAGSGDIALEYLYDRGTNMWYGDVFLGEAYGRVLVSSTQFTQEELIKTLHIKLSAVQKVLANLGCSDTEPFI